MRHSLEGDDFNHGRLVLGKLGGQKELAAYFPKNYQSLPLCPVSVSCRKKVEMKGFRDKGEVRERVTTQSKWTSVGRRGDTRRESSTAHKHEPKTSHRLRRKM